MNMLTRLYLRLCRAIHETNLADVRQGIRDYADNGLMGDALDLKLERELRAKIAEIDRRLK